MIMANGHSLTQALLDHYGDSLFSGVYFLEKCQEFLRVRVSEATEIPGISSKMAIAIVQLGDDNRSLPEIEQPIEVRAVSAKSADDQRREIAAELFQDRAPEVVMDFIERELGVHVELPEPEQPVEAVPAEPAYSDNGVGLPND